MEKPLQILIVEDNPDDADLLVRELHRAEFHFEWKRVDTEDAFVAALAEEPDLVLSDYDMPRFSGLRALELLREKTTLEIPFIILSGTIGEDVAVKVMQRGASDYLLKDRIVRLGPAVRRALREIEEGREHRRLREQFLEAQKMEVVGQLAGGVAHDFNNVLGVIMGYGDLLAQELQREADLLAYVEEIRHAAKRAAGLTQQLLIFSRKQAVQAVVLDPNEAIRGMEKMLRRLSGEHNELAFVYGQAVGRIKIDSGYLWQLLMNLVVNARDAMPNGGTLTIETAAVTPDGMSVSHEQGTTPGNYFLLTVSDTGMGMTEEVRAHIFEAFFTTKPAGKGTGLGLATCQTIVQQADGHIDVFSEVGKGATFRIYFPLVEEAGTSTATPEERMTSEYHGTETLMVVEDDPSLRNLARGILAGQGYRVLTAANGQEALRTAQEHQGPPISLVVTDVVMPKMNGKVMAEWLKESYPEIRILFTSGYTDDAIARYGVLDPKVDFLAKPYDPSDLTRKVREILDKKMEGAKA